MKNQKGSFILGFLVTVLMFGTVFIAKDKYDQGYCDAMPACQTEAKLASKEK